MNRNIADVIEDLRLTKSQIRDKDIGVFAMQVAVRKKSGDWYQYWNGNGFCELNKNDGTMITTVLENEPFVAEFPLNCDMEISKKCTNGCKFCYAGCTPDGKHADIKKFIEDKNSFLYSLHEGTELALNGNEPLHPDLELLLKFCKERGIIANLTVHEGTLLYHKSTLLNWLKEKLINGIGISPSSYSNEMIEFCRDVPTAVIHTIAGITSSEQYNKLKNKDLKILILGYKNFGRGVLFKETWNDSIKKNIEWLKDNVKEFPNNFKVVSFDNLAITQLDPKNWLTDEQWQTFYRGDDGSHTMFIDLVNETYAMNSMQERENHKPLTNEIRDMLKDVQNSKK
jgi:hypothetical protein